MREYSPKRRTALVFAGSGTSGGYHAGALRALDESGVKVDLVVGSGAGTVAAAFAAVGGSAKLYGPGGFWDGVGGRSFYRLRPVLVAALALQGASALVFLLPLAVALVLGLLLPLALVFDRFAPGLASHLLARFLATWESLSGPYLAALALPAAALSVLTLAFALWRRRRGLAEAFESPLSARPAEQRLRRQLWEVARGAAPSAIPPADAELGRKYVALAVENLGEPGFREMILRAADLEASGAVAFVLLRDDFRKAFSPRSRGGRADAVDLRARGCEALLVDAVLTGLLPPMATPVRRVGFPRGGPFPGETHRLTDATGAGGTGLEEAMAAGAEQVILVTAVPEAIVPPRRRRGPRALLEGLLLVLERQAVERDVEEAERINRMVETFGHKTESGERAWQDPANGRLYRSVALYVIRPERRALGPLELGGSVDPVTEVTREMADVLEQGYRDAYRLFVEPVVGGAPHAAEEPAAEERQAVEL